MIHLKYILCIVVFSKIDGESCALNGDVSDIGSASIENNEIERQEKIKDKNGTDKLSSEEYDIDKDYDTYEQRSAENKAERELNNNTTEFYKNSTEYSSLEDDIIKADLNNKIDNDLEPTTDVAVHLNKTTRINIFEPVRDTVNGNLSVSKMFLRPTGIVPLRRNLKDDLKNRSPSRMFFKNCRDKDSDALCRNTLIDYPYAASIQKKGAHYATGALVDKRWILTVAGEFYTVRESIKFFRARLGSVNCKRGGIVLPLQEVSIHPLYVHEKPGYDLALLRMGEPVAYSQFISPIRLSAVTDRVLSAKFMTMYWPRLIVKGELLPEKARERTKSTSMRVSTQRLIGSQYCHKMMLEMNEHLEDTSLCLKPLVTHHSLCLPDPGAPIVADDGLWGITSGWTSKLCYSLPGPTIFTRISAPLVRSWLDSQLLGI